MKKSIFLTITLMIAAFAVAIVSCKKEKEMSEEMQQHQDDTSVPTYTITPLPVSGAKDGGEESKMIIGSNRDIPFSMRNMRAAANFINANSHQGLIEVVPTHYYVQFNPSTEEHLVLLDSLCNVYALFNYPIQNEIVQEGSYLSTSKETQNKFDPLYSSIPIGDVLPNVPYTVIDTLFDPDEEQFDLTVVSYVLTGNADELGIHYNGENLTASTLVDYLALPEGTRAGGDYYPEGILKVQTTGNTYVPVSNTKLQVVRWGIPYAVFTDANGHFRLNKKMRGMVKIRATWRNGDYIIRKSWNEMLGIATSDAITNMNQGTAGQYTEIKIAKTDSHLWFKATVSNALYKYNQHMEAIGVTGIHNDANIWVIVSNSGKGGAALLAKKYSWAVTNTALLSGWLQHITPITFPIVNGLNLLFRNLYPDIVLSISNSNTNTENIDKLLFHEAGHFSHGVKAGCDFWRYFVNVELENIVNNSDIDPYQNGIKPSYGDGQLIALCEGWADFCRYIVLKEYYYSSYPNYLENYIMRTTPSIPRNQITNSGKNFWWLSGLFWDIVDNSQETNSTRIDGQTGAFKNSIVDNLRLGSLDNLIPVYNCMVGNTKNGNQLKSRLLANYPSKASQINELFVSYGY